MRESAAFIKSDAYEIVTEQKTDGWAVGRAHIREPPPTRLGVILGDFFHNLRSALDNLAYQLILLQGRQPGARETIGFPLFDTERSYKAVGVKRIKGVSEAHAAMIEGLQPYPGRDAAPVLALSAVSRFAALDKHRQIHPTLAFFDDPRAAAESFRREPMEAEFDIEFIPTGFGKTLEDGDEIARFRATTTGPQPYPKPKIEAEFTLDIAFGQPPLRGAALPTIRGHVRDVVERFAPDFPAEP